MRAALASGTPVLLVAAHQCNWEWMLLALSLELGYPLDAAYKPLVDGWAQREMLKARSRFGAQSGARPRNCWRISCAAAVRRAPSPWSPTRSRAPASAATGPAS